jgi:2-C-methyl-D-erythritol 2,4-cyclodiphosphate synthase
MDYRIGQGYDLHRLEEGPALVLGGVTVPASRGAVAHSDGDVLLHAITDAILGALGREDIGALFPDTDAANAGRDSGDFVREALWYMHQEGFGIVNVDSTLVLEAPKLSPHKGAIRDSVSKLLETDLARVNVKAKTNEKCDAIGFGDAIAAHAVVLLRRG